MSQAWASIGGPPRRVTLPAIVHALAWGRGLSFGAAAVIVAWMAIVIGTDTSYAKATGVFALALGGMGLVVGTIFAVGELRMLRSGRLATATKFFWEEEGVGWAYTFRFRGPDGQPATVKREYGRRKPALEDDTPEPVLYQRTDRDDLVLLRHRGYLRPVAGAVTTSWGRALAAGSVHVALWLLTVGMLQGA